jgi:hypothetical protein
MAVSANPPETAIFPWFFIPKECGCFRWVEELEGEGEDGGQRKGMFVHIGRGRGIVPKGTHFVVRSLKKKIA